MDNLLHGVRVSVELGEVSRLMGYPSPEWMSAPVREVCVRELERLPALCEPWGAWRDFALRAAHPHGVTLAEGPELSSPRLAKLLRKARFLRLFVATLGERLSQEVRQLGDQGAMLEAMALDAAATAAVHAVTEELVRRTCDEARSRGLGTTIRYAPGYTGWRIDDIAALFAGFADEPIPVRLNAQLMMQPEKSLLSIVGLTEDGRIASPVEQCRGCDLVRCSSRRAPFRSPPQRPSNSSAQPDS